MSKKYVRKDKHSEKDSNNNSKLYAGWHCIKIDYEYYLFVDFESVSRPVTREEVMNLAINILEVTK